MLDSEMILLSNQGNDPLRFLWDLALGTNVTGSSWNPFCDSRVVQAFSSTFISFCMLAVNDLVHKKSNSEFHSSRRNSLVNKLRVFNQEHKKNLRASLLEFTSTEVPNPRLTNRTRNRRSRPPAFVAHEGYGGLPKNFGSTVAGLRRLSHYLQRFYGTDEEIVDDSSLDSGFISLDCGLRPSESPYTDPVTGLTFTTDANIIQNGKRGEVNDDETHLYQQYRDLTYFPDGIRNCYNLNITQGIKYLIRAGFSYGNYDGLNVYPKFDMYVGPNLWTKVDLEDNEKDREIIYLSNSEFLQICLVKTGTTAPMISTLELRPLPNNSYVTQFGPLKLGYRQVYTNISRGFIRYPDDVFDRKWERYNWYETSVSTTLNVNSSEPFQIPVAVSRLGILPRNVSRPLRFYMYPEPSSGKVLVYFHFSEIQTLGSNDTREFNILLEEIVIQTAYSPKLLQSETKSNISPQKCSLGICILDLVRTQRSTLPPLVNAIEAFSVHEFPYAETNPNDVAAMRNIVATYRLNIISWQGDPCVPQLLKWEDIKCSYDTNISPPPRIISLDLSSRGLSGNIAPAFQNLTELRKLDLANNSLTGKVPEFLAHMESLTIINLNWNKLTGPIPKALLDKKNNGLKLTIQENPDLCIDASCQNNNKKYILPVVASTAAVLIILAVLVLVIVLKKKKKPTQVQGELPSNPTIFTQRKRLTYAEVVAITNNFERVLGEGGFGVVYHGSLNGNQPVAVKVLSQSSVQGYKEFKAEVELLLRVHHVNLVSLVGYCDEEGHLALLYEYAANGNLIQHLSGERGCSPLKWSSRLKIAAETAQGLEYLHTGCKLPMVHRDVKSTNILLDEHFQAKLADFGLSRSFPVGGETQVSTAVAGTPGYLDPEYYRTNRLNEKSDVYSFGIVLLEMITSRPAIQQTRERSHIAAWVGYMLTKGDIENVVDPRLDRDYDPTSLWKAVEIAMSCVNPSSRERPNMSQVCNELKECLMSDNSRQERGSKSSVEWSTDQVTPKPR